MNLNWKTGLPFFVLAAFMAWLWFFKFPEMVDSQNARKKEALNNIGASCKNLSDDAQVSTKALCNMIIPWNEITHPIEEYEQRKEDGGV